MLALNLADWIERRNVSPKSYKDHIVHSVRAYEREIRQLRERVERFEPSATAETNSTPPPR